MMRMPNPEFSTDSLQPTDLAFKFPFENQTLRLHLKHPERLKLYLFTTGVLKAPWPYPVYGKIICDLQN